MMAGDQARTVRAPAVGFAISNATVAQLAETLVLATNADNPLTRDDEEQVPTTRRVCIG